MPNMTAQSIINNSSKDNRKRSFFYRSHYNVIMFQAMLLRSIVFWGFKHLTLLVGFNVMFQVAAMGTGNRNAGRFASKLLALFSFRGKGTKHTNVQQTIIFTEERGAPVL